MNPTHDAAQRTHDANAGTTHANAIRETVKTRSKTGKTYLRKEYATPAQRDAVTPTYRDTVLALATRIADRHIRTAQIPCSHLREEFITDASSAISAYLAAPLGVFYAADDVKREHPKVRFAFLMGDVVPRFAIGALPARMNLAMHRTARKACDARMRRMGGKDDAVDPSFFNLFTDDSADRSSELDMVFVNARIDYLLGLVRARCAVSGNAARAAKAHIALLESARAYFIASIKGEAVSLPSAGLVASKSEVGFNVSELRSTKGEKLPQGPTQRHALPARATQRTVLETSAYVVSESRGTHLANSALYMRLLRLARFTGEADVLSALSRQARR